MSFKILKMKWTKSNFFMTNNFYFTLPDINNTQNVSHLSKQTVFGIAPCQMSRARQNMFTRKLCSQTHSSLTLAGKKMATSEGGGKIRISAHLHQFYFWAVWEVEADAWLVTLTAVTPTPMCPPWLWWTDNITGSPELWHLFFFFWRISTGSSKSWAGQCPHWSPPPNCQASDWFKWGSNQLLQRRHPSGRRRPPAVVRPNPHARGRASHMKVLQMSWIDGSASNLVVKSH